MRAAEAEAGATLVALRQVAQLAAPRLEATLEGLQWVGEGVQMEGTPSCAGEG